jgi:hypothetical protein
MKGVNTQVRFKGLVDGDTIRGTMNYYIAKKSIRETWTATRDPSSRVPLDSSERAQK